MNERAGIDRRTFLKAAGGGMVTAASGVRMAAPPIESVPIVDSHIHLFDPNRPQGVPYKADPKSPTYTAGAFPAGYKKLAAPLGIVGAVKVEASPWIEDNLWLLEVWAKDDPTERLGDGVTPLRLDRISV